MKKYAPSSNQWLAIIVIIMVFQTAVLFGFLLQNSPRRDDKTPRIKILHSMLLSQVQTEEKDGVYSSDIEVTSALHNAGSEPIYVINANANMDCLNFQPCYFENDDGRVQTIQSPGSFVLNSGEAKTLTFKNRIRRILKPELSEEARKKMSEGPPPEDFFYVAFATRGNDTNNTFALAGPYSVMVQPNSGIEGINTERRFDQPEVIMFQQKKDDAIFVADDTALQKARSDLWKAIGRSASSNQR